jgi:hypothetical protein
MSYDSQLTDTFKRAAAIASAVPESMQNAAFLEALKALGVNAGPSAGSENEKRPKAGRRSRVSPENIATSQSIVEDDVSLLLDMSRDEASEVDHEEQLLGKILAVLRIAHRDLDIEGLTYGDVHRVLTEKFRWKVTPQGVRWSLQNCGPMVDTVKRGSKTLYRIMQKGEDFLDTPEAERKKPTGSPSRKRTAKKPAKTASAETTSSKRPAKASSKAADAPPTDAGTKARKVRKASSTPSAGISVLIASGFLSQRRTISAIREQLQHKHGMTFRVNELSMPLVRFLRSGAVDRDKNDEGQYEYIAK